MQCQHAAPPTARHAQLQHLAAVPPARLSACRQLTVLPPLPVLLPPPAAFNDPFIDAEYAAYMFKYDTVVRRVGGGGQG